MTDKTKAAQILTALDNGRVPITWAAKDEPVLIETIANTLRKIDREEWEGSYLNEAT